MMTGKGRFGAIEMGGMLSVVKVRYGQKPGDYKDPGWYRQPPGTQAREWSGDAPGAARKEPPATPPRRRSARNGEARVMGIEFRTLLLGVAVAFAAGSVGAHGDRHEAGAAAKAALKTEQKPFGIAGDPKKVSRTVSVDMSDAMRFSPAVVRVRRGETLRFTLANKGKVMHEMVLGTKAELAAHAALMRKFPGMEHDEPYMTHVPPGETGAIVWRFNRAGEFDFACLVAGHFEAGMVGRIIVK